MRCGAMWCHVTGRDKTLRDDTWRNVIWHDMVYQLRHVWHRWGCTPSLVYFILIITTFNGMLYVRGNSCWIADLSFLKLGICYCCFATAHLPGCFCPQTFFWSIVLNTLLNDAFMSNFIFNKDILQESCGLCNRLSLRCLVTQINKLPPVCRSNFWKLDLKNNWSVNYLTIFIFRNVLITYLVLASFRRLK